MRAWEEISQVEIIAIADPDLERASQRADEFNIDQAHVYTSLENLLGSERGLDFVDIAAPPDTHLELVELAAAHGLHVNCQKPFAPSLEQARQMIETCREAGVLLNINENWRWRPWYRTVHQMIHNGEIGHPAYARLFAHNSFWLPGTTNPGHRFLEWPRVILYDFGIHHIDIFRFLFGEVHSVFARMEGLNANLIGEDRVIVVLAFSELTGLIDLSWSSYAPRGYLHRHKGPLLEDLRIEGDLGTIEFIPSPEGSDLIRLTNGKGVQEQPAYYGPPFEHYLASYHAAQRHFIDCLISGALPETAAEDNIETLAITLAAYQSAERNQVVMLSDFKKVH
jgi:predicted dehydrogenase